MKGINPDASWEAIMEVVNALAPLLIYPITDIQKVTKRKIIFYEDAALSVPLEQAEAVEKRLLVESAQNFKIIPFPVPFRQPDASIHATGENCRNVDNAPKIAKILPFQSAAAKPSSRQMELPLRRAPPFIAA